MILKKKILEKYQNYKFFQQRLREISKLRPIIYLVNIPESNQIHIVQNVYFDQKLFAIFSFINTAILQNAKKVIKYNGWQQRNGPIIHDITSVKCNKEDYSLPTFIYAKYIYIYLI